jgi:hypothetical protein
MTIADGVRAGAAQPACGCIGIGRLLAQLRFHAMSAISAEVTPIAHGSNLKLSVIPQILRPPLEAR